nr:putative ribonuclease H-like domain-containing protein [Tanacetum cinerariifolium]
MNYVPVVVAGTSSTNFSGTKDAASQDVKKDVSSLRYITLPNWFHKAHLESSTSNAQDACNTDAPESSGNSNPTATSTNPSVYQMDVKSIFLYGTIDEKVYVMQPPGFQDPEFPARVYKVEKVMCGLHQAPSAWYGTLSKYLLTNGFQRGIIDQTLFIRRHRGDFILVQVYVDDIIFGSSNLQLCREFEALIHDKFQMSAMGELNFFLGLQVQQKKDGIFLSQDKYVGDNLEKFRYLDVRSANTPTDKENP